MPEVCEPDGFESSFILSDANTGARAAYKKMTFCSSPSYPPVIVLHVKGRVISYWETVSIFSNIHLQLHSLPAPGSHLLENFHNKQRVCLLSGRLRNVMRLLLWHVSALRFALYHSGCSVFHEYIHV